MDLDQIISKMERDLEGLKRARDIAQVYAGGANGTPPKTPGGPGPNVKDWKALLPEVLADGPLGCNAILSAIQKRGGDVAYSTLYSWLVRSPDAKAKYEHKDDGKFRLK